HDGRCRVFIACRRTPGTVSNTRGVARMRLRSQYFTISIPSLLTILLTAWNLTFAQNGASSNEAYRGGGSDKSYSNRTHSIDERNSRAEQEAERLVSLPAETIIVLLRREPGL